MSSTIRDDLRSFRRSWVHHTGMQLATLTVLSATFTVIAFTLSLSLNFKRILSSWGDGVRLSVYVGQGLDQSGLDDLRKKLTEIPEIQSVSYVASEVATEGFKAQMASYAPDLLDDADFSNPFPASFKVVLKRNIVSEEDVALLEGLAAKIGQFKGVEDVSYGQSWLRNYSSFVSTITTSGAVMIMILLAGSILVIGNSVRGSISTRREEIEILELVGATSSMIRRPFVVEGLIMGSLAALFALIVNLGIFMWQKTMLSSSLALARVVSMVTFLDFTELIAFLLIGASMGALGAWLTVRKINDGWSASARLES